MTDVALAALEGKVLTIDSDFLGVHYAIHKGKQGMSIISGDSEIVIHADNVYKFLDECWSVWRVHGRG